MQPIDEIKVKNRPITERIKKNDVRTVVLNKEQEQLLSSLSNDIDILNLLFD